MSQRHRSLAQRGSRGYAAKLVRMGDRHLGLRTFGQFHQQLSSRPDRQYPVPLTDLYDGTGHVCLGRQAIQDTIVGQVAIPADLTLFSRKTFPGESSWKRREGLLFAALLGPFMRGAMHPAIDALTPGMGLTVEIIDIGERDPGPEALLDEADRAFDFPLRLRSVGLADPWGDPNGGHEIGKTGVPAGRLVLHVHQDTLHAVCQSRFGQSPKVFKGLHQTPDHCGAITALDEGHKAHARVAEDGGKSVDLARGSLLFIRELAPVKLDLFSWLGFKALDWCMSLSRGAQGMHKGFEHAQASRVAESL